MEKYTEEKAREEAEKLQQKMESGLALNYIEAEQILKKETIEQVRFPNQITIIGGALPDRPDGEAIPYQGGTVEILDDGTTRYSGFGLESSIEIGSPQETSNHYVTGRIERKKEDEKSKHFSRLRFPMMDRSLHGYTGKSLEDAINVALYSTRVSFSEDALNSVPESNKELRDKVFVVQHALWDRKKAKELLIERPDLARELFLHAIRECFSRGGSGHSKTRDSLIIFLLQNPESTELFPADYQGRLNTMFFKYCQGEVTTFFWEGDVSSKLSKEERSQKLEDFKRKFCDMSQKLKVSMTPEEIETYLIAPARKEYLFD
ncbi:MAG: hypothetical protein PHV93_01405 [Candidatus Pacebacteria bacterium]|nr:hypothetical protein [Candidatus Paceibacterota bacterium]